MAANLPAPPNAAPARPSEVRVLARGLAILRAFEPVNEWRTNTELATLTELPKPTVSRLTANLTESGYLIYSAERATYRLNTSVLALGFVAASNRNLVAIARPLMQAFADQHNLSVVLASPDGGSMVCNEVTHSRSQMFTLRVRIGSHLRMGQSALGRALIGSMGDAERSRVLARLEDADHDTWSVLQGQVKTVVSQMQRRGYVIAAGTLEHGTNGVAVVIDTPDGPHAFSLGCAAPSGILSISRIENEVTPDLLVLKQRLEAELSVTAQGVES